MALSAFLLPGSGAAIYRLTALMLLNNRRRSICSTAWENDIRPFIRTQEEH